MASASASASAGAGAATTSANKAEYGDGYKMVISKKGPLFVHEVDGQKTRFATVPGHLSIQTATRADAEAAFVAATAATTGESLGDLEGHPVTRKKGPYGHYVTWQGHNVNCKADETLTDIGPRLFAKATPSPDAVDHVIGPYKIKKGPYGLYMFKTGGVSKPTFVSIPAETAWVTLTPEGAEALYKSSAAAVKDRSSGSSRGRGRGRGRGHT
jgi:topoisomerase IA-like protein